MYYRKGVIRVVKWEHRVLACLNNWPRDSTFEMVIASSKKGGFIVPYELHSRSRGCVPKISRKLAWFFFFSIFLCDGIRIKSFWVKNILCYREYMRAITSSLLIFCCVAINTLTSVLGFEFQTSWTGIKSLIRDFVFNE